MDAVNHAVFFKPIDGIDKATLDHSLLRHLHYTLAKDKYSATLYDYYLALVYSVRDRLIGQWVRTQQQYYKSDRKRVYYLSMEFLTGRTLGNSLVNLGLLEDCRVELAQLDLDLDQLLAAEWEAGLGNGGLGRLAACLMDSMATLGIPAYGYGIRYEYGIFQQRIESGYQIEAPDNWLKFGNPWEIGRPEDLYPVSLYGEVQETLDDTGERHFEWKAGETVMAMAYDMPVPGYCNDTVNTLRLWAAKSSHGFNLEYFNRGDYIDAVIDKDRTERISRVLYPNDNLFPGKELRLKQEYLLVSASLQDILRRFKKTHDSFETLPDHVAIQLNDTHPALAIPELMHQLVDREGLPWDRAWEITVATFGYTNHTLLPEALEEWPVSLLGRVLPRHLQIIYEINRRFLHDVEQRFPGDVARQGRMSLVAENGGKRVRMCHLAVVGSHVVNGVSKLHSQMLKSDLLPDFDQFFPWRFTSTTNGVTPRRWLKLANPRLASLITDYIGDDWVRDLTCLEDLQAYIGEDDFRRRWAEVKQHNKLRLAQHIRQDLGLTVNPESIFDCQVKRIHEYKRQLLNILHAVALYDWLQQNPRATMTPRTIFIGGKAAPGYDIAKTIIKLINSVAEVVNRDPRTREQLQVVFLPNYGVSLAEIVIPAADLSQQISTAGTEASGTGNMKFALNGALTIGTLDGANIEIKEAVGDENIFTFGLTADQVKQRRQEGQNPWVFYHRDQRLRRAIDLIREGHFSPGQPDLFQPLLDLLFEQGDRFMVIADFADYADCQSRISQLYQNHDRWTRKSIINVARTGHFSSDQTVLRYAREIWGIDVGPNAKRRRLK